MLMKFVRGFFIGMVFLFIALELSAQSSINQFSNLLDTSYFARKKADEIKVDGILEVKHGRLLKKQAVLFKIFLLTPF